MLFKTFAVPVVFFIFFFKKKAAYELRISDWSSDVCSSDLRPLRLAHQPVQPLQQVAVIHAGQFVEPAAGEILAVPAGDRGPDQAVVDARHRSDRKSTRLNSSH